MAALIQKIQRFWYLLRALGNSPESLGHSKYCLQDLLKIFLLIITCAPEGKLAFVESAGKDEIHCCFLFLVQMTRAFAMTGLRAV